MNIQSVPARNRTGTGITVVAIFVMDDKMLTEGGSLVERTHPEHVDLLF